MVIRLLGSRTIAGCAPHVKAFPGQWSLSARQPSELLGQFPSRKFCGFADFMELNDNPKKV